MPKPPNYATGLLLNIFLPGSGFTYLGRWGWHMAWMLGLATLSLVALGITATTSTRLLLLLPVLAYLGMLIHYHALYGQMLATWAADARPVLSDGVKLGLIFGHVALGFVGFTLTGVLAAAVLPEVLATRQISNAFESERRRYDTLAQDCGKNIQLSEEKYKLAKGIYASQMQLIDGYALSSACSGPEVAISQRAVSTENHFRFFVNHIHGDKTYDVIPNSVATTTRQ